MEADEPGPVVPWNIQRQGRPWTREEWDARRELTPDKNEMIRGKLYWRDEDRLTMLALLLENLGADRAVRLGDPRVWREAVAALGDSTT
jgi:hypothetical protein